MTVKYNKQMMWAKIKRKLCSKKNGDFTMFQEDFDIFEGFWGVDK